MASRGCSLQIRQIRKQRKLQLSYIIHVRFESSPSALLSVQNVVAIQSFHGMLTGKGFDSYTQSSMAVQHAMDLYARIEDDTTHLTMNALLKLLLHFKQSHRVYALWDDLVRTDNLSFPLWLKCCVYAAPMHFDVDRCIQVLSRMNAARYRLQEYEKTDFSKSVCKLIVKVSPHAHGHTATASNATRLTLSHLQSIQSLMQPYLDMYHRTALIAAYGRFNKHGRSGDESEHALSSAQKLFASVPLSALDSASVSAMMTALIAHQDYAQALQVYHTNESLWSDVSHKLALKACIHLGDRTVGERIASRLSVLQSHDVTVKRSLIHFYAHFGDLQSVHGLLDTMSMADKQNDVVLMSILMKMWNRTRQFHTSLQWYDAFPKCRNDVTDIFALNACKHLDDHSRGVAIHSAIKRRKHVSSELMSTLVYFYAYFGEFALIDAMLSEWQQRTRAPLNAHLVGTLMTAYIHHEQYAQALAVYDAHGDDDDDDDPCRNEVTHMLAVKACMHCGEFEKGKRVHDVIERKYRRKNIRTQNTLIAFYGKFGDIARAKQMFDADADIVSLNNMMRAYMKIGQPAHALALYDECDDGAKGLVLNEVSHIFALQACVTLHDQARGERIRQRLTLTRTQIGNLMIDFYGSFGDLAAAENLFEHLQRDTGNVEVHLNSVSLNSLMKAYVHNDAPQKALSVYDVHDTLHDEVSHICALKACTALRDFECARKIMDALNLQGIRNLNLKITMIDAYGNFGRVPHAQQVFDSIANRDKNIDCVNAMMEVHVMNERHAQCLQLFQHMSAMDARLRADAISYVIALKACIQSASFEFGQRLHDDMRDEQDHAFLRNAQVQSQLIAMYGAMGQVSRCQDIFDDVKRNENAKYATDIDLWNAMLNAYGLNGQVLRMQSLLAEMKTRTRIALTPKIYTSLINSYSHCGDVEAAVKEWQQIDIENEREAYDHFVISAMVDCLSRSGQLQRAFSFVHRYEERAGIEYYGGMWSSLLNGCYKFINAENQAFAEELYPMIVHRFHKDEKKMKSVETIMSNIRNYKTSRSSLLGQLQDAT